jgi:hypothetical protein
MSNQRRLNHRRSLVMALLSASAGVAVIAGQSGVLPTHAANPPGQSMEASTPRDTKTPSGVSATAKPVAAESPANDGSLPQPRPASAAAASPESATGPSSSEVTETIETTEISQSPVDGGGPGECDPRLYRAVRADQSAQVEALLLAKVSPQGRTVNRSTLLHLACEHLDPRTAMWLVRAGADVDARDATGATPMDVLRKQGYVAAELDNPDLFLALQYRMAQGIVHAVQQAEELVQLGEELNQLRCQLIAEFEVDRERLHEHARQFSFRVTGGRWVSSERLRFGSVDGAPDEMGNPALEHELPTYELTTEAVPLPDDFDSPLELPTPPQFEQAIQLLHWSVLQAGLAFGVSDPRFRIVIEESKRLVRRARAGQELLLPGLR